MPVCWIIYIKEKVIQPQKIPKRGTPAPSELSQPVPLVFSMTMKALPSSHRGPREKVMGQCSGSFAPEAVQQPTKTRLQAKRYSWGYFKEAAGCYAR